MRLPLPDLLATRTGRLVAFFLLYVTEGIPLGFAATAVAAQLRQANVSTAEIGIFTASLYLPWGFKWLVGPVVDLVGWRRVGHRRGWILLMQLLMVGTLLSTMWLKLPEQIGLFTAVLFVHNIFGATQDVAIDALACNTLTEKERGIANGAMFAGSYIGMAIGGSGVLYLTDYMGAFQPSFYLVCGAILAVTIVVVLPMREPPMPAVEVPAGVSRVSFLAGQIRTFAGDAFVSFLGSRGALAGLFFTLLPPGAMSIGLIVKQSLTVDLGMSTGELADLSLVATVISAGMCVLGGFLSDRFGRRKMLFLYIAFLWLPVAYLAFQLHAHGWNAKSPEWLGTKEGAAATMAMVSAVWVASLGFAVFQGLMYGTRSAIMMDVTNPAVAGTQFTAYMALANVTIAYTSTWQGTAVERWGYPTMMVVDIGLGLLCLLFIPFLVRTRSTKGSDATADSAGFVDERAPSRARLVAGLLAVACCAWWPLQWKGYVAPAAEGGITILGTFFTLVSVLTSVFLLAGGAILRQSSMPLARAGAGVALAILALHLLPLVTKALSALQLVTDVRPIERVGEQLLPIVAAAAAVVLVLCAMQSWIGLKQRAVSEATA